jgi:hypothetical protein
MEVFNAKENQKKIFEAVQAGCGKAPMREPSYESLISRLTPYVLLTSNILRSKFDFLIIIGREGRLS